MAQAIKKHPLDQPIQILLSGQPLEVANREISKALQILCDAGMYGTDEVWFRASIPRLAGKFQRDTDALASLMLVDLLRHLEGLDSDVRKHLLQKVEQLEVERITQHEADGLFADIFTYLKPFITS